MYIYTLQAVINPLRSMTKISYLIAALLLTGLVAWYFLSRAKSSKPPGKVQQTGAPKNDTPFPPTPAWKPNLPVDIDLVYEKAKYYTGSKMQFAVFENGTVAYFGFTVGNVKDSALSTLNNIFHAHPDCKPTKMNDGNYLVEYSQPAFTIVFKDEIEKNWSYINRHHQHGVCKDEVLINGQGQSNVFDSVGKICLFARAKMFMDAQSPKVVKIFDPVNKSYH
jgi:hypothetical protein